MPRTRGGDVSQRAALRLPWCATGHRSEQRQGRRACGSGGWDIEVRRMDWLARVNPNGRVESGRRDIKVWRMN